MMRQYRIIEYCGFQWIIQLYHNGKLTKSYKVYVDELETEAQQLEVKGYEYGYTEEEFKEARERYESMLGHIISPV